MKWECSRSGRGGGGRRVCRVEEWVAVRRFDKGNVLSVHVDLVAGIEVCVNMVKLI
jgi:hypothetical protein